MRDEISENVSVRTRGKDQAKDCVTYSSVFYTRVICSKTQTMCISIKLAQIIDVHLDRKRRRHLHVLVLFHPTNENSVQFSDQKSGRNN